MKKSVKILSLLLAGSFTFGSLTGCELIESLLGGNSSSDSEQSSSLPDDSGSTGSESTGSESTGSESTGSDSTGSDSTGSESSGSNDGEDDDPVEYPFDAKYPEAYNYQGHISEAMPRIEVTTEDGKNDFAIVTSQYNKWDYVNCTVNISNCEEDYALSGVTGGIKIRGNYTTNYEKKPLRFKFDKKQPMLGLNGGAKCKSWVLLADYKDASLLRNSAAFYFGQTILGSDGYYCSDFRNVEVYLNGQYWGVYLLAEQQQINSNRIDINEAEKDYTGTDIGYFLEYDGYYNQEDPLQQFTMNYNNHAPLKQYSGWTTTNMGTDGYTIKSDVYSAQQRDFIASYMENLYRICYNAAYNNQAYIFNDDYTAIARTTAITPREAIEKVVDVQSMVDAYIIQEICCDTDISWSSFLMDVDMSATGDKLLRFEAPWDFDSALGNRPSCETGIGLYAANSNNPWLILFINQDWFRDMIKAKWRDSAKNGVFTSVFEFLDRAQAANADEYNHNYEKWNNIGHAMIVGELCAAARACRTQKEAYDYFVKWLTTRLNYLDTVWGESAVQESKIPDLKGMKSYRYEAENATVTGGITVRQGNGASGNGYLGNVAGGEGKTISFTVNAASASKVYLYVGLSKREFEFQFDTTYSVYVNDQKAKLDVRFVQAGDGSWHDWTDVAVGYLELSSGDNTVVIRTEDGQGTNIDYIDLYSSVTLK